MRYTVKAVSQMQTLIAKSTADLDDALETRNKLEAATTNGTFTYEVWDGAERVYPAATVVL